MSSECANDSQSESSCCTSAGSSMDCHSAYSSESDRHSDVSEPEIVCCLSCESSESKYLEDFVDGCSEHASESESNTDTSSENDDDSSDADSSVSEDGSPIHPSVKESLYPGSAISVFMSHLLLYQFSLKNSLTNEGCTELIQLLKLHMPMSTSENLPKSVYALKQFFTNLFPDLVASVHYYCSCCHKYLEEGSSCVGCTDGKCTVDSFISVPLEAQLKRKLEDRAVWTSLQQRFKRYSIPEVIRDVFDGEEYKRHALFLSQPGNISLTCNCDGVALFRSSTVEIWPVWLSINELPMKERFLQKNIMLAALWFSADKPTMNTFLGPLVDSINELYTKGFVVQSPEGATVCRAILLQLSADLPARCRMANMKQFNGRYGCVFCENPGSTRPGNHLHRFWPHIDDCPLRSHDSMVENASQATIQHKPVMGVLGVSVVCLHDPLDVVKGFVIDDLHCLFLGVTKHLLSLWFDKKIRETESTLSEDTTKNHKELLQKTTANIKKKKKLLSERATKKLDALKNPNKQQRKKSTDRRQRPRPTNTQRNQPPQQRNHPLQQRYPSQQRQPQPTYASVTNPNFRHGGPGLIHPSTQLHRPEDTTKNHKELLQKTTWGIQHSSACTCCDMDVLSCDNFAAYIEQRCITESCFVVWQARVLCFWKPLRIHQRI